MKKPILSTLLFFLLLCSVNAQNYITGTITDAYKTPLPFANIILHKQGGDEMPKGVISLRYQPRLSLPIHFHLGILSL